jgi:hypothetical protein
MDFGIITFLVIVSKVKILIELNVKRREGCFDKCRFKDENSSGILVRLGKQNFQIGNISLSFDENSLKVFACA